MTEGLKIALKAVQPPPRCNLAREALKDPYIFCG